MSETIDADSTTRVSLARTMPVHLTYATVWIGEGGSIHFREGVYGRDVVLAEALFDAPGTEGG